MKKYQKSAALLAVAVLLAALMTGCWRDKNTNGSSSSMMSSSVPPMTTSSIPSSSMPPETSPSTQPGEPSISSEGGSHTSSSSSSLSSSGSSSSSSSTSSSVAALGTDFEEIGALPAKELNWGPGGPVDALNRSQGSLSYNKKFGCYDAVFIGEETKTVYMTFDEGYEYGLSGAILDTLRQKKVKAVFFVTYDFANRSGGLVQRMIDEGHIVGNHSYSHKNYSTMAPKQAADDMMKMHHFIKEKFGYEMTLFRFPSGNFNEQSLATVQKMGYRSIFWSFAYKDWLVDRQPEPVAAADKIIKAACPGNIYLLHAVSDTNNKILSEVIDSIRAAGFQWGDPAIL